MIAGVLVGYLVGFSGQLSYEKKANLLFTLFLYQFLAIFLEYKYYQIECVEKIVINIWRRYIQTISVKLFTWKKSKFTLTFTIVITNCRR
jgi:hypothetical protein